MWGWGWFAPFHQDLELFPLHNMGVCSDGTRVWCCFFGADVGIWSDGLDRRTADWSCGGGSRSRKAGPLMSRPWTPGSGWWQAPPGCRERSASICLGGESGGATGDRGLFPSFPDEDSQGCAVMRRPQPVRGRTPGSGFERPSCWIIACDVGLVFEWKAPTTHAFPLADAR